MEKIKQYKLKCSYECEAKVRGSIFVSNTRNREDRGESYFAFAAQIHAYIISGSKLFEYARKFFKKRFGTKIEYKM